MKKLIIIILIFCFSIAYTDVNEASRLLKLANSYLMANKLKKAELFIKKAENKIATPKTWEEKYWNAVAKEYSAYVFIKLSEKQLISTNKKYYKQVALEHLDKALKIYKNLVTYKNGSQDIVKKILDDIKLIEAKVNDLSDNNINNTTDGINILNYDNLKLREIPNGIPDKVENMSFSNNKFRDFPSGLVRYNNLKYLNLSNNKIKKISEDIEQLNKLKWLDLSGNKLKDMPLSFCNLTRLEELNLSDNNLKVLPACLCKMKNLKILNLQNNKLPFREIAKLFQCLPRTNIFIDEYEIKNNSNTYSN